mmetsp:Transcript_139554/g.242802  ORF Transcript_139554/g.242802 Transcript_139554/m.242802 type:complete len:219 (-) Transcript_139554:1162-1818(-)
MTAATTSSGEKFRSRVGLIAAIPSKSSAPMGSRAANLLPMVRCEVLNEARDVARTGRSPTRSPGNGPGVGMAKGRARAGAREAEGGAAWPCGGGYCEEAGGVCWTHRLGPVGVAEGAVGALPGAARGLTWASGGAKAASWAAFRREAAVECSVNKAPASCVAPGRSLGSVLASTDRRTSEDRSRHSWASSSARLVVSCISMDAAVSILRDSFRCWASR